MKPLAELRQYLADFGTRCKAARWLGALFHVGVCTQIVADVAATEAQAAQRAYDAEQADCEAERELEAALADGLDASDLPRVKRALAHVRHSAASDRATCDLLTT